MSSEFANAAKKAGFVLDDAQLQVARRLSQLADDVRRSRLPFGRHPRGVYLWGPVGRGKSWLTTAAFTSLETRKKRRFHFHQFFRDFHAAWSRHRDEPKAVDLAVKELLGECRVLCFDEFHVHDPGDAMLIGRLLKSLHAQKITLLATSNYPPSGLLPNPLYHHLFEPFIGLLESTMDVVELTGARDYRVAGAKQPRSNFESGLYLWPGSDEQLREAGLNPPSPAEECALIIAGRELTAAAARDGQVWFGFDGLCEGPTSSTDYLELADRFATLVIAGVPPLSAASKDAAQRFANVIDILCDRDVRLVLVASAPLEEVLRGGTLPIDVDRMASRLSLLSAPSAVPLGG